MKTQVLKRKKTSKDRFNSVEFFRDIKERLAEQMAGMSLKEQQNFMKKIKEGENKNRLDRQGHLIF